MRKLILVLLVVLLGGVPAVGYAQTPPANKAPVTAPAPATKGGDSQASIVPDDTKHIMTIGLGAIAGMVVLSVISTNVIGSNALANLGKGAVVFVGTVTGGLIGNWLYSH